MQKLYFLKYSLISILLSVMCRVEAQSNDLYYRSAQNRLTNMLSGKESLNLREAIYCVENAWFNDKLNKKLFLQTNRTICGFCRAVSNSGRIIYSKRCIFSKRPSCRIRLYDRSHTHTNGRLCLLSSPFRI